ncbi:hypothetical protein PCASD_00655 [Puccinia coronata f. sp. avenae]|uniref:Uncharacterized protein n=1 Tax=Puccinia coronata f. sp. avenae TaxID=200324 RepID=A0A2N5VL14_9BASI|nr:hypothetical protein PCASD_00655 [Puccinia coronata f. sp. avenae]
MQIATIFIVAILATLSAASPAADVHQQLQPRASFTQHATEAVKSAKLNASAAHSARYVTRGLARAAPSQLSAHFHYSSMVILIGAAANLNK